LIYDTANSDNKNNHFNISKLSQDQVSQILLSGSKEEKKNNSQIMNDFLG